ncbi:proprotein_convertase subtilisin/kexin type 5-like [Hexamita inflata]|uniref:Proprotein convertase subtilisin/kexin type 5-like n=1 Tax=Hexamita inflata TaxID=28002 RepID=A0AA86QGW9_9EUKA|nr:proprotein convertase subtilisin/kexin type 5-like [Hexamita inflata]
MSQVNKRCVFNCSSEDYGRLTNLAENSCEQICSNGYANVARLKCVDDCYTKDNHSAIHIDNKTCITTCTFQTNFLSTNLKFCVDSCYNDDSHSAINYEKTKCVPSCPPSTYLSVNKEFCVKNCYNEDSNSMLSLNKSICVTSCFESPNQNGYQTNDSTMCVASCYDDDNHHVLNVAKTQCHQNCDGAFYSVDKKFCVANCKTDQNVLADLGINNCVQTCTSGYVDITSDHCTANCTADNASTFTDLKQKKCVDLCIEGYLNVANLACVAECFTNDHSVLNAAKDKCISACNNLTEFLTVNKKNCVVNCKKDDKSFLNMDNTCVSQCKNSYVNWNSEKCVTDCHADYSDSALSLDQTVCETTCSSDSFKNKAGTHCVSNCYFDDSHAVVNLQGTNCEASCSDGFMDLLQRNCISICVGFGVVTSGSQCACGFMFKLVNGQCVCDIDKGYLYNNAIKSCICDVNKGFQYYPDATTQKCNCDTSKGYNSVVNNYKCDCDTARGFLIASQNSQCNCDVSQGFLLAAVNYVCQCNVNQGFLQSAVGFVCTCDPLKGFTSLAVLNGANKECRCLESTGFQLQPIQFTCVCRNDKYLEIVPGSKSQCRCIAGRYMANAASLTCSSCTDPNTVPNALRTQCECDAANGFKNDTGTCVCIGTTQYKFLNIVGNKCTQCDERSQFKQNVNLQGKCECWSDKYVLSLDQTKCISTCDAGQFMSVDKKSCVPSCGSHQLVQPGTTDQCMCISTHYWTGSQCVQCGLNQIQGPSGSCVCVTGYGGVGCTQCTSGYVKSVLNTSCILIGQCTNFISVDKMYCVLNCSYKTGITYFIQNGQSNCVSSCQNGEHLNYTNGQIMCSSETIVGLLTVEMRVNGVTGNIYLKLCNTVTGTNGHTYFLDNTKTKCVSQCSFNDMIISIGGEKMCRNCSVLIQNSVVSADYSKCICQGTTPKLSLMGQVCQYSCGTNEVYDTTSQKCVCTADASIVNNLCSCNSNFISVNNLCVACGQYEVPNKQNNLCVCKIALALDKKSCVPECGPNENNVNGSCQCSFKQNSKGHCEANKSARDAIIIASVCIFITLVLCIVALYIYSKRDKSKVDREVVINTQNVDDSNVSQPQNDENADQLDNSLILNLSDTTQDTATKQYVVDESLFIDL